MLLDSHPDFEEDDRRDFVYWASPLYDHGSDWDAFKDLLD